MTDIHLWVKAIKREQELVPAGFSGIGSHGFLRRKRIEEYEEREREKEKAKEMNAIFHEITSLLDYVETYHDFPSDDQLKKLMPVYTKLHKQIPEIQRKALEKCKQSIIPRKQKRIKDNFKGKLQSLLEHTSTIPDLSSEDYIMDIDDFYFSDLLYHNTHILGSTLESIMEHAKNNDVPPYVCTYRCEDCGIYNEMPYLFEEKQKYYNSITQLFLEKFLKDELPPKSRLSVGINVIEERIYIGEQYIGAGNRYSTEPETISLYEDRYHVEVSIEFSYPQKN